MSLNTSFTLGTLYLSFMENWRLAKVTLEAPKTAGWGCLNKKYKSKNVSSILEMRQDYIREKGKNQIIIGLYNYVSNQ